MTSEQKAKIEEAKDALKKALEGDDISEIKAKTEALNQALHEVSTAVYQQAPRFGGAGEQSARQGDRAKR